MESLLRQIPGQEDMWIGADLNGHVGGTRTGFEREHGGNSWGDRNAEGEVILKFAQAYDLGVVNTFFQKKMEHLITYKSGERRSVIDYILIWCNNISKVKDCKVIPGESIATQHILLTMDIGIQTKKRVKPRKRKQQIKWWRLKDRDENRKFASKVEDKIKDIKDWNQLEALLLDTAKNVLGETTGKGSDNEKEAWWWNEDVQKTVKEKRLKSKKYQESRCDEDKEVFREANKRAKREVAKAKESAYKDLYDKLDSIEGQKIIYKLSKTRERRTRDLTDIKLLTSRTEMELF